MHLMGHFRCIASGAIFVTVTAGSGSLHAEDFFNAYISRSIDEVMSGRKGLGYKLTGAAYTQSKLDWGPAKKSIPAIDPPRTMCVAAVNETLIEAMNLYHKENEAERGQPFAHLAAIHWDPKDSPLASFAHYSFMHEFCTCEAKAFAVEQGLKPWECNKDFLEVLGKETQGSKFYYLKSRYYAALSTGTAPALQLFGMGERISSFSSLTRGDVVNFDRTSGGGHAVIFEKFISRTKGVVDAYPSATDVVGFQYFSAQTTGTKGIGVKYAYFADSGSCPSPIKPSSDCGIKKESMVMGRMWHPSRWKIEEQRAAVIEDLRKKNMYGCVFPKKKVSRQAERDILTGLKGTRPGGGEPDFRGLFERHGQELKRLNLDRETVEATVEEEMSRPVSGDFDARYDGITPLVD
ncbi:MAG: hypothetical protein ACT4N2_09420 [Hyphomicrobium sp.]